MYAFLNDPVEMLLFVNPLERDLKKCRVYVKPVWGIAVHSLRNAVLNKACYDAIKLKIMISKLG